MSPSNTDPTRSAYPSNKKSIGNTPTALTYDFIDPSEDYVSIQDKENSFQQYSIPSQINYHFPNHERSNSFQQPPIRPSPAKFEDKTSVKNRGSVPHYIESKPNSALRSHNYSPVSNQRSTRRSPSHKALIETGNNVYDSGQKVINFNPSSIQVMRKVFDEDYSLVSPQPQFIVNHEEEHHKPNGKDNSQLENPENPQEIDFEILDQAYQIFLNKLKMNPKLNNSTIDDYIYESIEYLKIPNQSMKIGAIINLFDIIFYNSSSINSEHVVQISTQMFSLVHQFYASDDFYILYLALEVLRKHYLQSFYIKSFLRSSRPQQCHLQQH